MADIQTMERALKNAHSAGDTAAAKKLAQAIISARSQSQPAFDPASVALPDINLAEARAETNRREYENLPMWQKPLVALDDMATIFGDSASYGLVAKGAATVRSKLKGTPYEKERAAMDRMVSDAKDRAGGAGLAASIGGAVAVPAKLAARGVTFTNVPKVGGLLGLTADGAAMGAADAFGHDEDPAMGAVSGVLSGAKDPFALTDPEIEAAKVVMKQINANMRFYWTDATQITQALANGEIVGAWAWNAAVVDLKKQGVPIAYMRPKEGIFTWVCGMSLLKNGTGSEQLAYDYINAMLDAATGQTLIEQYGYGHSNQQSFAKVAPERLEELGIANADQLLAQSRVYTPTPPETKEKLIKIFDEVKAGL